MLRFKLPPLFLLLAALLFSNLAMATPSDAKVAGFAGADYWNVVKQGDQGSTQAQGQEAGQLINVAGEEWRLWRNQWVTPAGAYAIGGTLAILAIFYLIVGQKKLDAPRSGELIERWKRLDRANHWTVAILFIILAVSGLSLLYGKFFLRDVLGDSLWANYIMLCKLAHNYLGPLFVLGLLFMIVRWMKHNIFNGTDIVWFLKGGGIVGKAHPSAGYMNGGEKIWFWLLTIVGLVVCASGLVMDFQNFGQDRETMQIANLLHGVGSLILIVGSFGHIYIGTLGTEGALEGMKTGYVDETWAKQHHDLWYEEVKNGNDKSSS
ncbi:MULTISPECIES: formate dehydrogenase subunit gamma [unclassified Neptuniibacter]|uniref:formate dehydrogenase subunit gamma n=1 Tax=unclassified Neptuniibacter TaxID=2630693 RepID=UPI000C4768FB|nr:MULTISPECIES: formate dehydrogenase subunit gamma [unclassified Neptuniibacter]MAY41045.1 formate dehydrogenase subunit gamma [Oceanospirillaceae bacterium]|tara:strand:+ start:58678 stop:59640 length:963 start_codon:yes stop_codon:yes gene_type:complete